ncbi:MAG: Grx4 family monothiol glutaredoxin [Mariprofundus sp.]
MSDSVLQQIDEVIKNNDVVLFMKGTPEFPQCGFSQRVAAILAEHDVPFVSVNVLLNETVRQGIKDYSDWPTIPQLYVKSEFVGGCDIVSEMHESGELKELLASVKK